MNDELLRNAMGNWDKEYRKMLTAMSGYLQQGNSLSENELTEVADIQKHILEDDGTGTQRLCELATAWVVQNPQPIALGKVITSVKTLMMTKYINFLRLAISTAMLSAVVRSFWFGECSPSVGLKATFDYSVWNAVGACLAN